jgi:hypothetical protein
MYSAAVNMAVFRVPQQQVQKLEKLQPGLNQKVNVTAFGRSHVLELH